MRGTCQLCQNNRELKKGHIVPKFVSDWLKDTSVTGFLRQPVEPNKRHQDSAKKYLFCGECEGKFCESEFASKIFYPYVNTELDEWGRALGKVQEIVYGEWLLRFIISLQFRQLITIEDQEKEAIGESYYKSLADYIPIWRDYLLSTRDDTGDARSYVIFLQNLAFGTGTLPDNLSERVNIYLLRSIDMTSICGETRLGLYTKLGPIVIFTSVIPEQVISMRNLTIKKKGRLITAQHLKYRSLNEFIFITRPKLALPESIKLNEKSQAAIRKSYEKNFDKVAKNMVTLANLSDTFLSQKKAEAEKLSAAMQKVGQAMYEQPAEPQSSEGEEKPEVSKEETK